MGDPFVGSQALASGALTRHELRTRFRAIHRDIYVARDARPTALLRAKAAWLRSRGHGVLAGFSASAFHGARWIEPSLPAYVIDINNRRPTRGIVTWADAIEDDEICSIGEIRLTTPARTAVDLACKFPEDTAVAAIDALARAAHLKVADIEQAADRHTGRKGIRQARATIALVDPGAESPQETWLRLLVIRAGYPRPQTQYPVYNEYGALIGDVDLAWPELKIALEYEGRHHTDPEQLRKDIQRVDAMAETGWIVIRVTSREGAANALGRIAKAWASRASRATGEWV
ncbi:hypothetical protein A5746_20620 [Mycolicibacterium conceptionense]|uniref:DUF559 domain-containing protein n=1 Tax=Mycolicibacterium conceptionense TaxID=451644 RepID=A0A0U1D3X6_9MYCO|nr:hypothetical protein [Mycolicibacterium conceptionense]OBJ91558.1 hypothetical protein A5639_09665 [Mycolicibacterium conceptionense]OMB86806.1 hypothetical protein A5741_17105 [Mycolicibacterium conceptionense]OMB91197.1 hypothetical protein A5746_20620 [Mycolicibacterium conceptionense]ORV21056.1 hypothetical protein AWB98_01845 [Mycolicibacterium conceptionense]CQD07749.1 hypothetical protein BN970_01490 [Mycolicibacterium conceptionense]